MSRRKTPESDPNASRGKKAGSPSVTNFLSKISSVPRGSSPAKGLLGDITREDLAAVGRLEQGESLPPMSADALPMEPVAAVAVGVSTSSAASHAGASAPGGDADRRAPRLAWSGTCEVRGVFSAQVSALSGGLSPSTAGAQQKVANVSTGGVFVETAHLLEPGDPVILTFPLDDGKTLVVNGRVRWVTPFGRIDDPVPGMGIEFVGVDAARREKLDALLARARSGPGA